MNFDFFQFCRNVNKSEQHGLTKTEEIAKGQLILKGHLMYSQIFQKTDKKIQLQYYNTLGQIVFVGFLEVLKTTKGHFEIN